MESEFGKGSMFWFELFYFLFFLFKVRLGSSKGDRMGGIGIGGGVFGVFYFVVSGSGGKLVFGLVMFLFFLLNLIFVFLSLNIGILYGFNLGVMGIDVVLVGEGVGGDDERGLLKRFGMMVCIMFGVIMMSLIMEKGISLISVNFECFVIGMIDSIMFFLFVELRSMFLL